MTTTQIMAKFIHHMTNIYDNDFEIQRIVQNEEYPYKYKVITKCCDYTLIILHTHDNSLCVRWEDDIYSYQDGEWRLVGTFY